MRTAQLLDVQSGTERLLSVYAMANKHEVIGGKVWYIKANNWVCDIAESLDFEVERIACATAALSPGNKWERNQLDLIATASWVAQNRGRTMRTGFEQGPPVGTYKINHAKAVASLTWECDPFDTIRGRKVTAFAQCLADPEGVSYGAVAVCVDRHAIRAYQGQWKQDNSHGSIAITSAMYDLVASGYRAAAVCCALVPMEFQATIWLTMKRLAGE